MSSTSKTLTTSITSLTSNFGYGDSNLPLRLEEPSNDSNDEWETTWNLNESEKYHGPIEKLIILVGE